MQLYHFMKTNDERRDLNELYRTQKASTQLHIHHAHTILTAAVVLDAYDKILSNLNNKCICNATVHGMHIIRIMPYIIPPKYIHIIETERYTFSRVCSVVCRLTVCFQQFKVCARDEWRICVMANTYP